VDLPAPDAPVSRTRSPGSMLSSASRTAHARRVACRKPQPASRTPAGARLPVRPSVGQTRERPEANEDSAPLAASARVSAIPPIPATTAVLATTSAT
jgi:hypothetical protein